MGRSRNHGLGVGFNSDRELSSRLIVGLGQKMLILQGIVNIIP